MMNERSTPEKTRKALLIVWTSTHFKELNRLAGYLHAETHYEPIMYLGSTFSATEDALAEWERRGIRWRVFGPIKKRPSQRPVQNRRILQHAVFIPLAVPLLLISLLLFPVVGLLALMRPRFRENELDRIRSKFQGRIPNGCQIPAAILLFPVMKLGFAVVHIVQVVNVLARTTPRKISTGLREIVSRIPGLRNLVESALRLREYLRGCRLQYRFATLQIRQIQPDVLILAEDNPSYPTGMFIRVGHDHAIPSVIVPYTLASVKEFVEGFREEPAHSLERSHNRWVARKYPEWLYQDGERGILRLPGHHILLMKRYGIAPARPWIPNDGYWDAFAAESPHMLKRYRDEFNMDPQRLALTGAVTDDLLFAGKENAAQLRESIGAELELTPGRPLILAALPPNQFASQRPEMEFTDYQEMLRFWIESLQKSANHNVVITLHPRTAPEFREFVESLGACVSTRDTLELVPACDVYVACASATIRWAVACGIPVINYDVFHYRYDDYDEAAGVITIQTRREFTEFIRKIESEPDWLPRWSVKQRACASDWGMVDGRSGRRMIELFDRLVDKKCVNPATEQNRAA